MDPVDDLARLFCKDRFYVLMKRHEELTKRMGEEALRNLTYVVAYTVLNSVYEDYSEISWMDTWPEVDGSPSILEKRVIDSLVESRYAGILPGFHQAGGSEIPPWEALSSDNRHELTEYYENVTRELVMGIAQLPNSGRFLVDYDI